MVKKSKKKGVPRPKPQRETAPNMFERLGNKKRFDVLGRKTKGDVRSINKLRSEATEKRKSTLLVEYRQLRKSNAFIDRRFGEDDDTLTPDERALLRFQKQRMQQLAGSKFALGDEDAAGEEAQLTHLGRSLAELDDMGPSGGWSSDDDANLDEQLTRDLHFGGGFVPSKTTRNIDGEEGDGGEPTRKSKKEVMEEIIAKSKMHKAMKSQQKEEDIAATDALDEAWKQLASGGALAGLMRPKGQKDLGIKAADDADKRFDVLTKELVFEAKAQPGERTLTADELAELEKHRLEELEKQRVKRQRGDEDVGGDDLEDDFGGGSDGEEDLPQGGYAARRAKRAKLEAQRAQNRDHESDSDEDDESDEDGSGSSASEDEDGLTKLERRRRDQASGDHPLQEAFRGVAAKLMAKHGLAEPESEEEEEEESASESEELEEQGGSSEEESGSEEEEESDDEEDEEEVAAAVVNRKKGDESSKPSAAAAVIKEPIMVGGAMTFTPPLPESYNDFASMAKDLSADDLGELLRRIRGFNAAALSTEGRKKTQILYGCVVQHYVSLAGAVPPSLTHLDALLPHILDLTAQVPFYAATLARTRLQRAQQQMTQKLKDPLLRASAWPAPKTLLLLKLLTVIYPVSDKRHPVLTPASLFATSALSLCPLARPRDIASGLFLAALTLQMHASAQRFCPEALEFAVNLLSTAVEAPSDGSQQWLALKSEEAAKGAKIAENVEELSVSRIFANAESPEAVEYFSSAAFKSSAAAAAVKLIGTVAASLVEVDALPEIMAGAVQVLKKVVRAGASTAEVNGTSKKSKKKQSTAANGGSSKASTVAHGVAVLAGKVLAEVEAAVSAVRSRRRPLSNVALSAAPETKQYNPRYEDQYATGKDYDPDRERAERRRLQRELRREERGAARELRRDAAFMAGVRDREKAALQADLDASARRAMSFLQQQQADAKSGGQGGMWKKKKNK